MKTGNTSKSYGEDDERRHASMEPGHEDREYFWQGLALPQVDSASMEPGHEDREYIDYITMPETEKKASMEPGHEDREYFGILT